MFSWLRKKAHSASALDGNALTVDAPDSRPEAVAAKAEGDAFLEAGDLPQALRCYRRVIEFGPAAAEIYRDLALLLVQTDQLAEARSVLDRGLDHHPGAAELHAFSGNLELHRGNFEDAVASLDRAVAIRSDFAEAYYNRGIALNSLGRTSEALASHEAA